MDHHHFMKSVERRKAYFRNLLIFGLSFGVMLNSSQLALAMGKGPRISPKSTIDLGEQKWMGTLTTPAEEADFIKLIRANVATGFVDDEKGFLQYWSLHKTELLEQAPLVGQNPMTAQMFLAQTYTRYKILSTNAVEDPTAFQVWLSSIVDNPWVEWASWKTWVAAVGATLFFQGLLKGALIAGPAAGAFNAGVNPVMTPINQMLTVKGNKYLGPVGMKLNTWLFDGKAKAETTTEAKEGIQAVRKMIEGQSYSITEESWSRYRLSIFKLWNNLNFLYGLVPDAYKAGRDRMADFAIRLPRDFASSTTNAMTAAEVQRQGAEQILNRLILKGANAQEVEAVGQSLTNQIAESFRSYYSRPGVTGQLPSVSPDGESSLIRLGATPEQAAQFLKNTQEMFVFQRQAAGVLAGQLIHDMMYSDTIKGAESIYRESNKTLGLDFMQDQLKLSVIEILDRLEFKVDLKAEVTAKTGSVPREAKAESSTKDIVDNVLKKQSSLHILQESGALGRREVRTPGERVEEAVLKAGRR